MGSISRLSVHERALTKMFGGGDSLVLFDIGACEGLSSVKYLKMFPNSKVFAFEPVLKNYEQILKNKENYKLDNLNVYQLGLSSKKGSALFYLSSAPQKSNSLENKVDFGNKSSSLLKPDKHNEIHPNIKFEDTIEIEIETLDSFCEDLNVCKIDFIHMDVQGAELEVLKGGLNMLPKINAVWLEVERVSLYEGQPLKDEIESFFKKHDFTCVISDLNHISGDQLWIKNAIVQQVDFLGKLYLLRVKLTSYIRSFIATLIGGLRYNLQLRTRVLRLIRLLRPTKGSVSG